MAVGRLVGWWVLGALVSYHGFKPVRMRTFSLCVFDCFLERLSLESLFVFVMENVCYLSLVNREHSHTYTHTHADTLTHTLSGNGDKIYLRRISEV